MSITAENAEVLLKNNGAGGFHHWTGPITYSFVVNGVAPSYYTDAMLANTDTGFGTGTTTADAKAVSAAQMQAFLAAMDAWKAVANIQLSETSADGDITILMSSAESFAPEPRLSDRWDRSLALFVDAMNHFGHHRNIVIDDVDAVHRGVPVDWLAAGSVEMEAGTRVHGGGHGAKRQLV